jgi:hypothetical protein
LLTRQNITATHFVFPFKVLSKTTLRVKRAPFDSGDRQTEASGGFSVRKSLQISK